MRRLLFLLTIIPSLAFGQFEWEKTELELKSIPENGQCEVQFHFKNTGKVPVKITSLQPDCGCTLALLDKREYQPGENGFITAVFSTVGRFGFQEKKIAVKTLADVERQTVLILRVLIPHKIQASANELHWTVGESAVAQKVHLKSIKKDKIISIRILGADVTQFGAKSNGPDANGEIDFEVWPFSAADPLSGKITVEVALESGSKDKIDIQLAIKAKNETH